jgi:hypothetical protein
MLGVFIKHEGHKGIHEVAKGKKNNEIILMNYE